MNKLQRIQLNFVGDKGKEQLHSKSFLHVDTENECLLIDWNNKTVDVYGKKKLKRHE